MKRRTLLTAVIGLGLLISPVIGYQVHAANQQSAPSLSLMHSITAKGPDSKAGHSPADHSRSAASKGSQELGSSESKKHAHKSIWQRIKKDSKINDPAHLDNEHSQISGMRHFIKQRSRYYYPKIGLNTRDLGGYVTANGRDQIRPDRIIRSASLNSLSVSGKRALNQLDVHQDVDLRYRKGAQGIQYLPDPGELHSADLTDTKIKFQNAPVYSHSESRQMHNGIQTNGEWYFYGWPAVTNPNAVKAYRRVFHDLLNNRHGAILYHCNAGRDRTGAVSALILSALGVKRSVIYHDYLLTDYYRHKNGDKKLVPYNRQAGELKHFFTTIEHKYGSVNHYLQSKVGLNKKDLKQLKKLYLVPVKN